MLGGQASRLSSSCIGLCCTHLDFETYVSR